MAQHPFFDVSSAQIAALGDEDLRSLIERLCEADLDERRLPTSAVLSGGDQCVMGGIDVAVELPDGTDIEGFIPRPATDFQSRAEKMPASKIANEMRPGGDPDGSAAAGSGADGGGGLARAGCCPTGDGAGRTG
jgi:hypothetical protein